MSDTPQHRSPAEGAGAGPPDPSLSDATAVEALSFDDALAQLRALVAALQRDRVGVDDLAASVAKGVALVRHCRARLDAAEAGLSEAFADLDGGLTYLEETEQGGGQSDPDRGANGDRPADGDRVPPREEG